MAPHRRAKSLLTVVGKGCGVVYELAQSGAAWTESNLYSFTDDIKTSSDGVRNAMAKLERFSCYYIV